MLTNVNDQLIFNLMQQHVSKKLGQLHVSPSAFNNICKHLELRRAAAGEEERCPLPV